MPYNNSAIPPPEEVTGQASLPLARVKRIIHLDDDVSNCSSNASFLITVATEMFVQYLAEQGHNIVKAERKPRRNIQYRDLASAVARIDNLEFLSDVIPKTVPYKHIRHKHQREAMKLDAAEPGQSRLEARRLAEEVGDLDAEEDYYGTSIPDDSDTVQERVARLDMEIRGVPQTNGGHERQANGASHDDDVTMDGESE